MRNSENHESHARNVLQAADLYLLGPA